MATNNHPLSFHDELREYNTALEATLKEHAGMSLKTFKSLKAGGVSLLIGALSYHAINNGADPTATSVAAIAALLALNGVELSEWLATKQSLRDPRPSDEEDNQ